MSYRRSTTAGQSRRKPLAIVLSVAIAALGLSVAPIAVSSASATSATSLSADMLKDLNVWRVAQGAAPIKLDAAWGVSIADENRYEFTEDGGGGEEEPTGAEIAAFVLAPDDGADQFEVGNFAAIDSTSAMALELAQDVEGTDGATTTFFEDNYMGIGAFEFSGRWYADLNAADFSAPFTSPSPKPHVTITGTAKVGDTLTAHSSIKESHSTGVEYIWFGVEGPEESGPTYTVTSDDIGSRIYAIVAVETDGHDLNDGYAETASVPVPSVIPGIVTVTGDRYVGHVLTVNPGTWTPLDTTLTYQWYSDNFAIQGATDQTYTQVGADVGHLITVRVYGSTSDEEFIPSSFKTTTTVKTGGPTITNTTPPSISGTDTVGQLLTVDPGLWDGTATFTYQWSVGGAAVSGATKSTFVIPANAYSVTGKTVSVAVTAHEAGYSDTTVATDPTATIAGLSFTESGAASFTGTAAVGDTIKAVHPTYTPTPTTYTYEWQLAGVTKSTSSSYKIPASDSGDILTLMITASKSGYVSDTRSDDISVAVAG
jgi:hypothetical protein